MDLLRTEVKRLNLNLTEIWLAHAHIDHTGGAGELAHMLNIPIIGPNPLTNSGSMDCPNKQMFGLPPAMPFTPPRWLHDGDTVTVGHCSLGVRHCPRHMPGHVVFHSHEITRAFVGDVLFAGSIGLI